MNIAKMAARTQPGKRRYAHGFANILKEYGRNTKGFRYLFIPLILGMVIDGVFQSSLVAYLKVVIDSLVSDPAVFVRERLLRYTLLGLAGGLLFFPFAYAGHFANHLIIARLAMRFRLSLYSHMQKLSLLFYQRTQVGEISRRLTGDIDAGVSQLVSFCSMVSWAAAMLACSLTSMLVISWKLTIVFVLMNAITIVITRLFLPRIRVLSRDVQDLSGELNAQVTEDVSAITLVKAFSREKMFFNRFRETQERLYTTQVRAGAISIFYSDALQVLFLFVAPVLILGTGAYLVDRGLSIGSLVAFWTYWQVVRSPSQMLFGSLATLYNAAASMDRVMEFFAQQPMPKDLPHAKPTRITAGAVEFRHVTFAYKTFAERTVLHDVSFPVPAHSSLGIVGPSGAGKSTLIQLLLRFYDPDAGAVLIDGVPLTEGTQEALRNQIGVVFQESVLLSGTIRENLLLGRERASEPDLWKALELAGAADFVRELEKTLDAELGERGVNLSGGQRQRLAIARIFLKNPPIVIFDEATSALDTTTEALIQESMKRLLAGRTSFTIAHRLSTVMACDRILLLDQGRVAGLAPHDELIRQSELYAELVHKQMLTPEPVEDG